MSKRPASMGSQPAAWVRSRASARRGSGCPPDRRRGPRASRGGLHRRHGNQGRPGAYRLGEPGQWCLADLHATIDLGPERERDGRGLAGGDQDLAAGRKGRGHQPDERADYAADRHRSGVDAHEPGEAERTARRTGRMPPRRRVRCASRPGPTRPRRSCVRGAGRAWRCCSTRPPTRTACGPRRESQAHHLSPRSRSATSSPAVARIWSMSPHTTSWSRARDIPT